MPAPPRRAVGLVGRDLLIEAVEAVVAEDATAAFHTAARAVELGYDLRLVCRELARVVRDLLVLQERAIPKLLAKEIESGCWRWPVVFRAKICSAPSTC